MDLTDNPEIQLEDDMVELELYPQLKYLFMDPQLLGGRNQIIASVCTNIVQINDTLINETGEKVDRNIINSLPGSNFAEQYF